MTEHSVLGASSMWRWKQCPASARAAFAVVEQGDDAGPFAARGSVLHAIAEKIMRDGDEPASFLDQSIIYGAHSVLIGEDEVNLVVKALVIPRILKRRGFTLEFEQRVYPPVMMPAALRQIAPFGTADVIGWRAITGTAAVVDYKFGQEFVDIVGNDQPMHYAAGAVSMLRRTGEEPRNVQLYIIQPAHENGVRRLDLVVEEIDAWVAETLQPAVDACCQPDPPYVDGPWCGRCPARQRCPRIAEIARTMMAPQIPGPQLAPVIGDAELARLLDRAEVAEEFIGIIRNEAERRLAKGRHLDGWKLVDKRATRKWIVDESDVIEVLKSQGFTQNEYMPRELLTPPALEKHAPKAFKAVTAFVAPVSSGKKLGRTESIMAAIQQIEEVSK